MSAPVPDSDGTGLSRYITARPAVITALGIDPGGTSGLFLGSWWPGERKPGLWRAWQCDMAGTPDLLGWILESYREISVAGIEAFDARERSRKMRGFSASRMHVLIGELEAVLDAARVPHVTYPPATVKGWATDKRLTAAGITEATAGMADHARDAGRACLFAACKHAGLRDPLSRIRTASPLDPGAVTTRNGEDERRLRDHARITGPG